jgi:hypothetical protein
MVQFNLEGFYPMEITRSEVHYTLPRSRYYLYVQGNRNHTACNMLFLGCYYNLGNGSNRQIFPDNSPPKCSVLCHKYQYFGLTVSYNCELFGEVHLIQHHVIKIGSDLRQFGGFLRVL